MLRGDVAGISSAVMLTTGIVLAIGVAFLLIAIFLRSAYWVPQIIAALFALFVLVIFLRVPVGYELDGDTLTVMYRVGSVRFGQVSSCRPMHERVSLGLRQWGNGGLFAFTGVYRNKEYGVFRAYITNFDQLVLVETVAGDKILISPANAEDWVHSQSDGT